MFNPTLQIVRAGAFMGAAIPSARVGPNTADEPLPGTLDQWQALDYGTFANPICYSSDDSKVHRLTVHSRPRDQVARMRELAGEIWAEIENRFGPDQIHWQTRVDVVDLIVAVLARHSGKVIKNGSLPVTPLALGAMSAIQIEGPMKAATICRVIMYFDKVDESYIDELVLPEIPLDKLQEVFQIPPGNPMYDSYPIGEKEAKFFYDRTGIKLDTGKYSYFLDCYEDVGTFRDK